MKPADDALAPMVWGTVYPGGWSRPTRVQQQQSGSGGGGFDENDGRKRDGRTDRRPTGEEGITPSLTLTTTLASVLAMIESICSHGNLGSYKGATLIGFGILCAVLSAISTTMILAPTMSPPPVCLSGPSDDEADVASETPPSEGSSADEQGSGQYIEILPAVGPSTPPSSKAITPPPPSPSVGLRIVIQRYDSAALTIFEDGPTGASSIPRKIPVVLPGLLVYVSFRKAAGVSSASDGLSASASASDAVQQQVPPPTTIDYETNALLKKVAKACVTLPLMTYTQWGDDSMGPPVGLIAYSRSGKADECSVEEVNQMPPLVAATKSPNHPSSSATMKCNSSILLVPQANLVSKPKPPSFKSFQYHGQADKSYGELLFASFCEHVKNELRTDGAGGGGKSPPKKQQDKGKAAKQTDNDALIDSWEDLAEGAAATTNNNKSSVKEEATIIAAGGGSSKAGVVRRLSSAVAGLLGTKQGKSEDDAKDNNNNNKAAARNEAPKILMLCGTFGKRQAVDFVAESGPFCHVVDF